MRRAAALALALLAAEPARAADEGEGVFCVDRPDRVDPACAAAPGQVYLEVSIADWSFDSGRDARADQILFGDFLVRAGVVPGVEARLGWTAYGRTREREAGALATRSGVGDLRPGARITLVDPASRVLGIALQPTVSIPVGNEAIGAGAWGYSLAVPVSIDLGRVTLGFMPGVEAAPDADRRGRHFAYSAAVVLGIPLADRVEAAIELYGLRGEDRAREEVATLDLTVAWRARDDLQLDVAAFIGLTRDAPDAQLFFGLARRF